MKIRSLKWGLLLLIAGILISGYSLTKKQLDRRAAELRLSNDVRYIPSPQVAKYLSLGYEEAFGDYFWIEGVNYYGLQLTAREKATFKYLEPYADVILSLDPYFDFFYEWAGTVFVYNQLPEDDLKILMSNYYVNLGIQNLHQIHRYHEQTIIKGAFNNAMELSEPERGIPYFALAGRTFPESRNLLNVAATYARYAKRYDLANEFKAEFLGFKAFEARNRGEILHALRIVANPFGSQRASEFIKSLRLGAESNEELRQVVQEQIDAHPILRDLSELSPEGLSFENPKVKNVVQVDFSRTWIPPELHVLLTL